MYSLLLLEDMGAKRARVRLRLRRVERKATQASLNNVHKMRLNRPIISTSGRVREADPSTGVFVLQHTGGQAADVFSLSLLCSPFDLVSHFLHDEEEKIQYLSRAVPFLCLPVPPR